MKTLTTTDVSETTDETWSEIWDVDGDRVPGWIGDFTVDEYRQLIEGGGFRARDGVYALSTWVGGPVDAGAAEIGACGPDYGRSYLSVLRLADGMTGVIHWFVCNDLADLTEIPVHDPEKDKQVLITWDDAGNWYVRVGDDEAIGTKQATLGLNTVQVGTEGGGWIGPIFTSQTSLL